MTQQAKLVELNADVGAVIDGWVVAGRNDSWYGLGPTLCLMVRLIDGETLKRACARVGVALSRFGRPPPFDEYGADMLSLALARDIACMPKVESKDYQSDERCSDPVETDK